MIDHTDLAADLQPFAQPLRTKRGVQQDDVDGAADLILARGERPTIEKVRQELGTGSPNTVTPLLDNWYRRLGSRLVRGSTEESSSGVPSDILSAVARMWDLARERARAEVADEIAAAREELAAEKSDLEAERAKTQEEAKLLAATRTSLEEGLRLAHAQLAELRKEADERSALLSREQSRVHELQELLETARKELGDAHASAQRQLSEQARLHAEERAREAERSAAAQRHQLQELDRSRQQAAAIDRDLQAALSKHAEAEARLEESRALQGELQAKASSLHLQLVQARTELQGARDLADAAQKIADASALRASELAGHLASARDREDDLRGQLRARGSRSSRLNVQQSRK